MSKKKFSKVEAIEYCLEQINSKSLDTNDFNKFRQYKVRYKAGKLSEVGVQSLFKRFGVHEHCYYSIPELTGKKKPAKKH